MSIEVRKKPLACQEKLFLYLLLIFWLAVFWPWTQSIHISSSVFCLRARHLPHNPTEYPMRRVGCRWSCVGIQDRGTFSKNSAPPLNAAWSVESVLTADRLSSTALRFLRSYLRTAAAAAAAATYHWRPYMMRYISAAANLAAVAAKIMCALTALAFVRS